MRPSLLIVGIFVFAVATQATPEHAAPDGRALFLKHCAECHGAEGRGVGPSSNALVAKPADLTQIAARRAGVWPMLEIMSIIDGYAELGDLRDDMPIIKEIVQGRMIAFDPGNGILVPTPARLIALAYYLERIQMPRPREYVP